MNKKPTEYIVFAGWNDKFYKGIDNLYMTSSDIKQVKRMLQGSKEEFDWCQIVDKEYLEKKEEGITDKEGNWKWM